MYGLVKTADETEIEKTAANLFRQMKDQIQTNGMSEEEFAEYTTNLKKQYGNNTDYLFSPKPTAIGGSYALNDTAAGAVKNSRLQQRLLGLKDYQGEGSSIVRSVPLKEIVLHETGHILDPEVDEYTRKSQKAKKLSGLASFGAVSAADLPEQKVPNAAKWALGLAGAGVSGVAAGRSAAHTNRLEDNANRFVKDHLAKELGSVEAAQQAFDNSLLPTARKTYGSAKLKGLGAGLKSGALFTAKMLSKRR